MTGESRGGILCSFKTGTAATIGAQCNLDQNCKTPQAKSYNDLHWSPMANLGDQSAQNVTSQSKALSPDTYFYRRAWSAVSKAIKPLSTWREVRSH